MPTGKRKEISYNYNRVSVCVRTVYTVIDAHVTQPQIRQSYKNHHRVTRAIAHFTLVFGRALQRSRQPP